MIRIGTSFMILWPETHNDFLQITGVSLAAELR